MVLDKLVAKPLPLEDQRRIVAGKRDWILSICRPTRIILFGSAADGRMTNASDVDLIIVFQSEPELVAARRLLAMNPQPDAWPHDLIFHTEESLAAADRTGGGASWLALREGKMLYQLEGSPR